MRPDALARHPRRLDLTPVGDRRVLPDPIRPIELYQVTGSQHSGSILIAYLPAERILIQADLDPADLIAAVERRGLRVDLLVGLHDRPTPWPPR